MVATEGLREMEGSALRRLVGRDEASPGPGGGGPGGSSGGPGGSSGGPGRCLVLDCRPFLAHSAGHIRGALNVRCNTIVRRRAKGAVSLEQILPAEGEVRARLRAGLYAAVVVYDERSPRAEALRDDSTVALVVRALRRDSARADIRLLAGGYERFASEYPEFCAKTKTLSSISPLSSAEPLDLGFSSCGTPLHDQVGPETPRAVGLPAPCVPSLVAIGSCFSLPALPQPALCPAPRSPAVFLSTRVAPWKSFPSSTLAAPTTPRGGTRSTRWASRRCSTSPPTAPTTSRGTTSTSASPWRTTTKPTSAPGSWRQSSTSVSACSELLHPCFFTSLGQGLGSLEGCQPHVSLFPCRLGEGVLRPGPRPLPGWHLPLGHHLPGLPDDEEARQAGGGLRIRQAAPQHHLPQLQLHGAAAAVRVSGLGHLLRRGSRQPLGDIAGAGQGRLHPQLPVCLQLPRLCGRPHRPQQPPVPAQPHHDVPQLLAQGLRPARQMGAA
uniref:Dual specificity phosphatase 4 n=1 Tax=Anas platyrhynchos TaxID=8839 RepID=A0A8B9QV44_ANAPL